MTKNSKRFSWIITLAVGLSLIIILAMTASNSLAQDNFIFVVDDGGVNQLDNNAGGQQSDLTRFGIDDTEVGEGYLWLQWSWDSTDLWSSAGQTGDACAIFDTNGNGNADYSICVQIHNPQKDTSKVYTTTANPYFFVCTADSKPDRCGNPEPRSLTTTDMLTAGLLTDTQNNTLITATDPFDPINFPPGGSNYPNDSTILLKIATADLPAGAELLNVCTYPSAGNGGNNAPGDCIVRPGAGFLTIYKTTDETTTDIFTFTLNPAATNGQTTFTHNGAGTVVDRTGMDPSNSPFSLVETLPSVLWELDSASCEIISSPSNISTGTFDGVNSISGISIQAGKETVCTFNNIRAIFPPVLSVVKTAGTAVDGATFYTNEPGGTVTFYVEVINSSLSEATLDSLDDDIYGNLDLNDVGNHTWITSNCEVPQTLAASNGSYSCSFTGSFTGQPGDSQTDTVTAGASNAAGSVTATDDAIVTIADVPAVPLSIVKSADFLTLPEPGGIFNFSVLITNNSTVDTATLTSVSDTYGTPDCGGVTSLAPGASVTCYFSAEHLGNFGDDWTNKVTVVATDDDGAPVGGDSNEITVSLTDVPAVPLSIVKSTEFPTLPEPGGFFNFSVLITNNSTVDTATLSSVTDTYGTPDCGGVTELGPGEFVTCTFSYEHLGNFGDSWKNTVTVVATDDDGAPVGGDSNEITVSLTDVLPDVTVTKTANPAPAYVPETGGNVTFDFVVTNNSTEAATITALSDDKFGTLAGDADCQVGTVLAGGVSCSFSATFAIPAGDYPGTHINIFTATGGDNDGNSDSGTDSETVTYTDVLPDITVTKTGLPTSVPEIGGNVTFTFEVINHSTEAATITVLSDNKFGTLAGDADCKKDTVLAAAGTTGDSCSFEATFAIPAGTGTHVDVFSATVTDGDGNNDTATDDETITYVAGTSKLAPTQTTCQMYAGGTAMDYTQLNYLVSKGKIGSVSPGVVFYWSTITAPSDADTVPFTLTGDQFNNSMALGLPQWKDMGNLDVFLWDSGCNKVQTVELDYDADGHPVLTVTGASPNAIYYFSIKYDTTSLTGTLVSGKAPTVKYTFEILLNGTLINTSPDSLNLVPKKGK